MDNDGGDLTHEEFARLFPRLRMVIFNSYSSTPEKPRWRVFIPTTVAMPIAAHKAIGEQIMRTLNRAGYWSKKQLEANERIKSRKHHGFDMGKLTPSSLFYLPCQAAEPGEQLLHRPQLTRSSAARSVCLGRICRQPSSTGAGAVEVAANVFALPVLQPMPPTDCPKLRRMRELIAEEEAAKAQTNLVQRQAAAIERWRSTTVNGNDAFFRLGRDLERTGMSLADIDATLRQEAGNGPHPSERRVQIKYIMRSLRGSPSRMAA